MSERPKEENFLACLTRELAKNLHNAGDELKEPYNTRARLEIQLLKEYAPNSKSYELAQRMYTIRQLRRAERHTFKYNPAEHI